MTVEDDRKRNVGGCKNESRLTPFLGVRLTLRFALVGVVVLMGLLVRPAWQGLFGVGILGVCAMTADTGQAAGRRRVLAASAIAAWVSSLLVLGAFAFGSSSTFSFNVFFAEMAWLVTVAICPLCGRSGGLIVGGSKSGSTGLPSGLSGAGSRREGRSPTAAVSDLPGSALNGGSLGLNLWKALTLSWAFLGTFIWLGVSYLQNSPVEFYCGLGICLALIIAALVWFRWPVLAAQGLVAAALVVAGLPIVDFFVRPNYEVERHPDLLKKYYSYAAAKKDPAAFVRWGNYCREQLGQLLNDVTIRETNGPRHFQLRPNSSSSLFSSRVSINSLGFRGREVAQDKGDHYRIVALGESTTFGITLTPEHRPWPEALEVLIRDRLKLDRPVEVINAGVPGATLPENVYRLRQEILALKPDMIISYHGYNGFPLLDRALPPVRGKGPPIYNPRPLKLLADCEYRLRLMHYKRSLTWNLFFQTPTFSNPLETEYAQAYRELIEIARTNGIRLVVANYSMAVNLRSDLEVIEFYRNVWPAVQHQIKANVAHSAIVQQLAEQHPEVLLVDTHPKLDGNHEEFIDLMHFTEHGDQLLAEAFFNATRKVLEADLRGAGSSRLPGE